MKKQIKITIASALLVLLTGASSPAQNLVQSLGVSLTGYDTVSNRTVKIGTRELIQYLAGTNVANAHLYLVTPGGNPPGAIGNLNAFLRITSGTNTVLEITSPGQFNLYQDFAALKTNGLTTSSRALNRFSFDSGSVRAELQGLSSWHISQKPVNGADVSGAGVFQSSVNGWIQIYNVNESAMPVGGVIVAGSPKPES